MICEYTVHHPLSSVDNGLKTKINNKELTSAFSSSSAAASVIPWAFFEESMAPIQMYKIIHQYK